VSYEFVVFQVQVQEKFEDPAADRSTEVMETQRSGGRRRKKSKKIRK
jgi:hypothetical protein